VPLVVVPGHQVALGSSPEYHRRHHRRNRAARAALDESTSSRSTSRCKSRTESSPLARIHGTPVRPLPLAAVRRRLHAHVRLQPPDQDLTVLIKPFAAASAAAATSRWI
jgi:hypothetical protein